ncbi:MAG: F-box-like domain-containing protein [Alphaproteobacteria bacterium]|nr:F-box-like domain-containing protein [Alphaproteobacteria bacterium]
MAIIHSRSKLLFSSVALSLSLNCFSLQGSNKEDENDEKFEEIIPRTTPPSSTSLYQTADEAKERKRKREEAEGEESSSEEGSNKVDLSDELLLYIFSFLNAIDVPFATAVNKRWRRLMEDNILWKEYTKRVGLIPENSNFSQAIDYKTLLKEHFRPALDNQDALSSTERDPYDVSAIDSFQFESSQRNGNIKYVFPLQIKEAILEKDHSKAASDLFKLSQPVDKIILQGEGQFIIGNQFLYSLACSLSYFNPFSTLTILRIKHAGLDDEGAMGLLCALTLNSCLKELDLSENQLESEDNLDDIIKLIEKKDNFEELNLSQNNFKYEKPSLIRRTGAIATRILSIKIDLRGNPLCLQAHKFLWKIKSTLEDCKELYSNSELRLDKKEAIDEKDEQETSSKEAALIKDTKKRTKSNPFKYTQEEIKILLETLPNLFKGRYFSSGKKLKAKEICIGLTRVLNYKNLSSEPRGIIDERTLFSLLIDRKEYIYLKKLLKRLRRLNAKWSTSLPSPEQRREILNKLHEFRRGLIGKKVKFYLKENDKEDLAKKLSADLKIPLTPSILLGTALKAQDNDLLNMLLVPFSPSIKGKEKPKES